MGYNVLFCTARKVNPNIGGTERVTLSVATGLKKIYNCKCYSVFYTSDGSPKVDCFDEELQVSNSLLPEKIHKIIEEFNIDIVINQGEFSLFSKIKKINSGTKFIMAHHFQPGWEENFLSIKNIMDGFTNSNISSAIKSFAKLVLYPFMHSKRLLDLKKNYKTAYEFADRVVLLSNGYVDEYANYAQITDKSKFVVIPNALSYDNPYDMKTYGEKGKRVLIVSRMEETQKRISVALRMWKKIKSRSESDGWTLDVVGDGPDLAGYRKLVAKEKIQDVKFWGYQVPDQFYRKASIFMMTSKSEGWGLTLTECHQFGVVPVVFNTCVVFGDIINNGDNGFLVDPDNEEEYVKTVCMLMSENIMRKSIADNGLRTCRDYSIERITGLWQNLFESI